MVLNLKSLFLNTFRSSKRNLLVSNNERPFYVDFYVLNNNFLFQTLFFDSLHDGSSSKMFPKSSFLNIFWSSKEISSFKLSSIDVRTSEYHETI